MATNERTPLLPRHSSFSGAQAGPFPLSDQHTQFCLLAGIRPSNLPKGAKWPEPPPSSIYQRAKRRERAQNTTYVFTAVVSQSLLLIQVILSAVLTALGAADSPGIYVATFGAINTVIGGLLAYFKGRGQPSRARLYREELESCIHQIENSEIMWRGITRNMHGYDEIDIDDEVSVRSEIARLTRLFEKAVKNNTLNNPDFYQAGHHDDLGGLRARPMIAAPAPEPAPGPDPPAADATGAAAAAPSAAPAPPKADPDESPATKAKPSDPSPSSPPAKVDKPAGDSQAVAAQNGSGNRRNSAPDSAPTTPAVESAKRI